MKPLRPFGVLLVLCVTAAIVIGSFAISKLKIRSMTFSDGTVLEIKAVTFGKSHSFSTEKGWQTWLRNHVPFTARFLPAKGITGTTSTSNDGLVFWMTHFDPKTGQHFDNLIASAVDQHGCTFLAGSEGGTSGGTFHRSNFEAFPRREPSFRMNARAGERRASFEIENPARGPFPKWTPEELPATHTDGDLAITLTQLRYHGDPFPHVSSDFVVRRNGGVIKDWQNRSLRLMDATGNAGWLTLCTNEPAWKVSAKFYRIASASFDQNEIWRLPKIRVPGEGKGVTLDRSNSLNAVRVRVLAFAGAGTHTISNGVFLSSSATVAGHQWNINRLSSKPGFYVAGTIGCLAPSLLLEIQGLASDDRLLVRARDTSGRIIVAENESASSPGVSAWRFHPSAVAEEVELELMLNKPRYAEFIVKPPTVDSGRSQR